LSKKILTTRENGAKEPKKKTQFRSHCKTMITMANKFIGMIWNILTKGEPFISSRIVPSIQMLGTAKQVVLHGQFPTSDS